MARMRAAAAAPRCWSASAPRSTSTPGWCPQAPAWMQRCGLEWAFRLRAGAAPPVAALRRATTRASCRLRPPVRAIAPAAERAPGLASLTRVMRYDVAVIGLGRVGLPLALSFADRGLSRARRRQRRRAARRAIARAADAVQGAGHRRAARARRRSALASHAADAAQADAIVLTLGTPSFSHIEIDMRDIRSVLDDLLPLLREGHLLVLRSTVAPGTTEFVAGYLEKQRGFRVGEDIFVAHVPERIAADRFMEEIGTLPCIVGGVGEASGERAARLFEPLGAPIVQTTPVQAELAKIWTNILRYATFALPNLLMMDCERYGANVFDVIELINRDYPRGGMAQPGLHRRHLPAQGLRVLRGALERARDAARRLARARDGAAVPRRRRQAPASAARCASARSRVLGLAFKADTDDERDSLSHKLIRLLERELADVAVHDPLVATPTRVLRGGRRPAPTSSSSPPTTRRTRRPPRCARSPSSPPRRLVVDPWNALGAAQVFAYVAEVGAPLPTREPRPRHRRRRNDRRGRRPAAAARPRLRGPRLRPARGAALDARGLRGPPRRPARARRGAQGDRAAARTSSTWRRSSAGSRTSTSSRTR